MLHKALYVITYIVGNMVGESTITMPYNILAEKNISDNDLSQKYEHDSILKEICNEILHVYYPKLECTILTIERIF